METVRDDIARPIIGLNFVVFTIPSSFTSMSQRRLIFVLEHRTASMQVIACSKILARCWSDEKNSPARKIQRPHHVNIRIERLSTNHPHSPTKPLPA
jgi:hypothetical protein